MEQINIRIGSRGSDLALWQANYVKSLIEEAGHHAEIIIIKTQGDKIQHLSFDKMEGKGFFTKEIEQALLDNKIDLAVHSHKDLETTEPDGLRIVAVPQRADVRDMLLIRKDFFIHDEPLHLIPNPIIGTSSARRKAQVKHLRPDAELRDLRGNVPTRIDKLRKGNYHAILVAKAGVDRLKLDLSEFEAVALSPETFVPAPAQGALALQIRSEDTLNAEILSRLDNKEIRKIIDSERHVLRSIHGGCQVPLGVHCMNSSSSSFRLIAAFAKEWQGKIHHFKLEGEDPQELSVQLADHIQKLQ